MRLPALIALATLVSRPADPPRTLVFQAVDAKSGAIVRGLQPEDLEVVDGDAVQPLSGLRFGASPMDLALVLDTGPYTIEIARTVAQGARLACSEFDPDDRLAFVTFASGTKVQFPFTACDGALGRRVERAVVSSSWSRDIKLYDGIEAAIGLFAAARDPARARAIVLVTNSLDRGSRADPASIERAAKAKEIALFVVSASVPWAGLSRERRLGPTAALVAERLRPVAEATGGEARVRDLSGYILRESFELARSRYVAAYTPTAGRPAIRLSPRGSIAFSNIAIRGAW